MHIISTPDPNQGQHLDHVLLCLRALAGTLDHGGQVTNWNLEWEVESRKHDSEEDPPSSHGCNKCASTTSNLQSTSQRCGASSCCHIFSGSSGKRITQLPVRTSKATK